MCSLPGYHAFSSPASPADRHQYRTTLDTSFLILSRVPDLLTAGIGALFGKRYRGWRSNALADGPSPGRGISGRRKQENCIIVGYRLTLVPLHGTGSGHFSFKQKIRVVTKPALCLVEKDRGTWEIVTGQRWGDGLTRKE